MTRASNLRAVLVTATTAACLAVGFAAAPAQAATGTVTWVNGGDYDTYTVTNPGYHQCHPVGLHSYGLVNNTSSYLQAYTSTTSGACVGNSISVAPGERTNFNFTSWMALG
ncbi:hypothetical protein ACIRRH_34940 [Kitasatospora sp. NPDC101235]|uniref:hypothetical protein n=1 Tax=Kitasatospora sp. NPDC101235 TaxID=3364101 RepID=UPI00382DB244